MIRNIKHVAHPFPLHSEKQKGSSLKKLLSFHLCEWHRCLEIIPVAENWCTGILRFFCNWCMGIQSSHCLLIWDWITFSLQPVSETYRGRCGSASHVLHWPWHKCDYILLFLPHFLKTQGIVVVPALPTYFIYCFISHTLCVYAPVQEFGCSFCWQSGDCLGLNKKGNYCQVPCKFSLAMAMPG